MKEEIERIYGGRVRVRICGLCWQDDTLLVVNHRFLKGEDFWAPPGGGLEFGESVEEALQREFKEETNLTIKPGKFLFGCEFIGSSLHAVELYFEATRVGGELRAGNDPELAIIQAAKFMSMDEILNHPPVKVHGIFTLAGSEQNLRSLQGFYTV